MGDDTKPPRAEKPLTDSEMGELRSLLEQDRRTRWLWSTARTWALWVTAVVAGLTVGVDALKTIVKKLMA
jgi:hypothetical protein